MMIFYKNDEWKYKYDPRYYMSDIEVMIPTYEFPKLGLTDGSTLTSFSHFSKATFDTSFALLSLILLSPIFLLIGIIIRIDSKGPVFFKQKRVGKDGTTFNMVKFRSMYVDSDRKKRELMLKNEVTGPVFKIKKDPRITKFGGILRRTGIDELPQLWNVLRGDMALIGPRPPLEEEVRQYDSWQFRRLSVKPGITCTWQIVPHRHDVQWEDWVKMDLDYIDNWNIKEDAKIFLRTLKTFFIAGGH